MTINTVTINTDICVLGGGLVGAPLAAAITRNTDYSCLVLEARSRDNLLGLVDRPADQRLRRSGNNVGCGRLADVDRLHAAAGRAWAGYRPQDTGRALCRDRRDGP